MNKEYDFKLCIQCFTFNHSEYILDAIDGFSMQQTNFKFIACIVDDASTDGEQSVLIDYLNNNFEVESSKEYEYIENDYGYIYFARHKRNINCYFLIILLKFNHYSKKLGYKKREYIYPWIKNCKYQSMCEGDDYWIDSRKLQKQVDILDTHKNLYMCGSNAFVHYDGLYRQPRYFNLFTESRELTPEEIVKDWTLPTASLVYRYDLMKKYPNWTRKIYSADQTRILLSMFYGGVYCLKDVTCIYRRTKSENSASNTARRVSRNFVTDQHIILYEEFNKFTNGKYDSIIKPHLRLLRKRSKVYKIMNKSVLLSFFYDPITFWDIAKKRLKL